MTKKELLEILDRYPDDWPLAWVLLEPEDIYSAGKDIGLELNASQIKQVMEKLSSPAVLTDCKNTIIESTINIVDNKYEDEKGEFFIEN